VAVANDLPRYFLRRVIYAGVSGRATGGAELEDAGCRGDGGFSVLFFAKTQKMNQCSHFQVGPGSALQVNKAEATREL
jgi:hypothetical protein